MMGGGCVCFLVLNQRGEKYQINFKGLSFSKERLWKTLKSVFIYKVTGLIHNDTL